MEGGYFKGKTTLRETAEALGTLHLTAYVVAGVTVWVPGDVRWGKSCFVHCLQICFAGDIDSEAGVIILEQ